MEELALALHEPPEVPRRTPKRWRVGHTRSNFRQVWSAPPLRRFGLHSLPTDNYKPSMKTSNFLPLTILIFILSCAVSNAQPKPAALGLFEGHGDVGKVGKPGVAEYDAGRRTYAVTGGGANMWFTNDAFHYVWKRTSGDLTLGADIRFIGSGGNAHRKACLLLRQTLDPDSAYADAVLHGDGLTSLQYRETQGGPTREIQANVSAPARIRIE